MSERDAVECTVVRTTGENEDGEVVDCVVVTCTRCAAYAEAWGHGRRSVVRALTQLRKDCPKDQDNWYEAGGDESHG